jgi:hypothetical protein
MTASLTATAGFWLRNVVGVNNTCLRVGDAWPSANFSVVPAGDLQLNDLNGFQRVVPYQVNVGTGVGQLVGYTKYLRQYKNTFTITPTLLSSTKLGSQQGWVGWKDPSLAANNHNQCLLWNKTVTNIS